MALRYTDSGYTFAWVLRLQHFFRLTYRLAERRRRLAAAEGTSRERLSTGSVKAMENGGISLPPIKVADAGVASPAGKAAPAGNVFS